MMTQETNFSSLPKQDERSAVMKSRLTLLGIIATFVVPLVLAMVLYARLDIWTPSVYVNQGRLVEPVGPLQYLNLTAVDGGSIGLSSIEGRWALVYLAEKGCRVRCQSQLFKMRQARAMLGRDLVRVQNLYLALDSDAMTSMSSVQSEYPGFMNGLVASEHRSSQLNAFSTGQGGHFFLIDPLGNLVLDYDENSTTKGVVKDLKRLLKVSNIG